MFIAHPTSVVILIQTAVLWGRVPQDDNLNPIMKKLFVQMALVKIVNVVILSLNLLVLLILVPHTQQSVKILITLLVKDFPALIPNVAHKIQNLLVLIYIVRKINILLVIYTIFNVRIIRAKPLNVVLIIPNVALYIVEQEHMPNLHQRLVRALYVPILNVVFQTLNVLLLPVHPHIF